MEKSLKREFAPPFGDWTAQLSSSRASGVREKSSAGRRSVERSSFAPERLSLPDKCFTSAGSAIRAL